SQIRGEFMYGKVIASEKTQNINGELHVVNPIVALQVPFLPTTISFAISCSFFVNSIQRKFDIKLEVIDHTDYLLGALEGCVSADNSDSENSTLSFDFSLSNVIFKNDGLHKVILYVEDEQVAEYSFTIFNQNIEI